MMQTVKGKSSPSSLVDGFTLERQAAKITMEKSPVFLDQRESVPGQRQPQKE